ncbi:hypothetical protein ACQP2Y_41175 [Actinoplanes sp. CA-051413]|uniref:hypothetical protein n=1 Tax=Actinoplanes sp. CA-051413 TaxID=3239899 RepID=UPI003D9843FC
MRAAVEDVLLRLRARRRADDLQVGQPAGELDQDRADAAGRAQDQQGARAAGGQAEPVEEGLPGGQGGQRQGGGLVTALPTATTTPLASYPRILGSPPGSLLARTLTSTGCRRVGDREILAVAHRAHEFSHTREAMPVVLVTVNGHNIDRFPGPVLSDPTASVGA